MSQAKTESKITKITVRFKENYNKKLYGNYFTTIRNKEYNVQLGKFYEIELNGKVIMSAQAIAVNTVKFHELNELTIMMDTGMSYSNALDLFKGFGHNITDFDLEVKHILFAVAHVYSKQPTAV